MNEVENFLNDHTFICIVFNGRMSGKQCEYQCARVTGIIKGTDDVGLLSDVKLDTCIDCMSCVRFTTPDKCTVDMLTNTAVRYPNSTNGIANRQVFSYVESIGRSK